MSPLEKSLSASIAFVRESKRQKSDLDEWLEAAPVPVPPKRLKRKPKMTVTALATRENATGAIAERVVILGDLSQLGPQQRSEYYIQVCRSLDLNPLTRPFSYLKLNGKDILYANKDCSDQLRKRDKVSISIVSREEVGELLVITARATLPDGRCDESIGALPLGKLQGEARANALMKCETKAKRRVTLSICGLGFLDETEVDSIMTVDGSAQRSDNGTAGAFSAHVAPGEDPEAAGDADLFRDLCGRFSKLEGDLEQCDSWDKCNALRAILGTRAKQSDLTRTMQQKAEAGDISPTQRAELGKTWMRCNRKLEKLESTLKPPPLEASFVDEPDGTEALGAEREPGEDSDEL